jgi:hypothetical protein
LSITVRGTVLGTDGKPYAGAQVVGITYQQEVPTTSDKTGTFSVTLNDLDDNVVYEDDDAVNAIVGRVTIYAPGFAVTGGILHRQGIFFGWPHPGR